MSTAERARVRRARRGIYGPRIVLTLGVLLAAAGGAGLAFAERDDTGNAATAPTTSAATASSSMPRSTTSSSTAAGSTTPTTAATSTTRPAARAAGYTLLGAQGALYPQGRAALERTTSVTATVVGGASAPTGGLWIATADGNVVGVG